MKKDYSVLLIQLDRNLASDVSTRCSGRPKLSSYQVESREPNNLSSIVFIDTFCHYSSFYLLFFTLYLDDVDT